MISPLTLALTLVSVLPLVAGHGHMTYPPPRQTRDAPNVDNLRFPLNMRPGYPGNDGCAGISRGQSNAGSLDVSPGQTLRVAWEIGFWTGLALHQGSIRIQISKSGSDNGWEDLKTISLVGASTVAATPQDTTVQLPGDIRGNPVLRWLWVASVTAETYINCADLKVNGAPAPPSDGGRGNGASPATDNNGNNGGTKRRWEFCERNTECENGCCSRKYSSGTFLPHFYLTQFVYFTCLFTFFSPIFQTAD